MTLKEDVKKGDYKLDAEGNKILVAKKPDISCIPHSKEKFMSISIGDLKFIYAFKFMATSLQKLVENLYDKDN